jgi:hypothetical protein
MRCDRWRSASASPAPAAGRVPDLDTLRVWNGNEGPTLEQLVEAVPPQGGRFF